MENILTQAQRDDILYPKLAYNTSLLYEMGRINIIFSLYHLRHENYRILRSRKINPSFNPVWSRKTDIIRELDLQQLQAFVTEIKIRYRDAFLVDKSVCLLNFVFRLSQPPQRPIDYKFM